MKRRNLALLQMPMDITEGMSQDSGKSSDENTSAHAEGGDLALQWHPSSSSGRQSSLGSVRHTQQLWCTPMATKRLNNESQGAEIVYE